jgi:hypothetical protein
MKVTKCIEEGQGSCKRCLEKRQMEHKLDVLLYEIEGYDGCYCSDCVKEIRKEVNQ